jgi:hypothetical protein
LKYTLGPTNFRINTCKKAYCNAYNLSLRTLDRILSSLKRGQVSFERSTDEHTRYSENWFKDVERGLVLKDITISAAERGVVRLQNSYTVEFAAKWLGDWMSLNGDQQPNSRTDSEIQIDRVDKRTVWKVTS